MEQEFCHVYVAKTSLDLGLTAKMLTQVLLSPKLAQSYYCYEGSQEVLPKQEAGTPPRQISHME